MSHGMFVSDLFFDKVEVFQVLQHDLPAFISVETRIFFPGIFGHMPVVADNRYKFKGRVLSLCNSFIVEIMCRRDLYRSCAEGGINGWI